MDRRILRTKEAAEYVGLAKATLEKLRCYGGGPHFVRLAGRAVGYDLADLDTWLKEQRANSTSEPRPSRGAA